MSLFLVIFFIVLSISVANSSNKERDQNLRKTLMLIKYPFDLGTQSEIGCQCRRDVYYKNDEPYREDPHIKEVYDTLSDKESAALLTEDQKSFMEEELKQYMCHRTEHAYIPRGMSEWKVYQEYPEYGMSQCMDRDLYIRLTRIAEDETPLHPEIWLAEKRWLEEWQRSERVVERWNKHAYRNDSKVPYEYNPGDLKAIIKKEREERSAKRLAKREDGKNQPPDLKT